MPSVERCVGCGARVPAIEGPTHPYIGASPGCWQVYGEVLAREYGEFANPPVHRLTVDAYAAQHPGVPGRRSSQSVAVHLMSLCAVLEQGLEPRAATRAIGQFLATQREFPWLTPPPTLGEVTVLDVRDATDLADHTARVERWARSVWAAWSAHHQTVRKWLTGGRAGSAGSTDAGRRKDRDGGNCDRSALRRRSG
jgi:hypothetical protein